jgi:DNA-binding transcriptional ArsR family regulator
MATSAGAFESVAEPARRRLLDELIAGPLPAGELARRAGLSQPNASRHLRVLREAGLVEVHPDGRRRLYGLRGEGFAEVARWLAPYVLVWQRGLGSLQRHLDEED